PNIGMDLEGSAELPSPSVLDKDTRDPARRRAGSPKSAGNLALACSSQRPLETDGARALGTVHAPSPRSRFGVAGLLGGVRTLAPRSVRAMPRPPILSHFTWNHLRLRRSARGDPSLSRAGAAARRIRPCRRRRRR